MTLARTNFCSWFYTPKKWKYLKHHMIWSAWFCWTCWAGTCSPEPRGQSSEIGSSSAQRQPKSVHMRPPVSPGTNSQSLEMKWYREWVFVELVLELCHIKADNCFILLVYTIHLSTRSYLVDHHRWEPIIWNNRYQN